MPPKTQPKCVQCGKNQTILWRNTDEGQICHDCYEQNLLIKTDAELDKCESSNGDGTEMANSNIVNASIKDKDGSNMSVTTTADEKKVRKSTRATRFKSRAGNSTATNTGNAATGGKSNPKGRNRRNLFKKTPFKTPLVQASTHTVESTFYKGSYLQVGDIVSVVDSEDNVYYAQIRGLLVDTYCEKSAFLTWLIPTQASPHPNVGFDASTYLIGPDEDLSRKLSCLEFVMHAPSNYYHDKTTPFPLPDCMDYDTKPGGFIWTSLPEYERNKNS